MGQAVAEAGGRLTAAQRDRRRRIVEAGLELARHRDVARIQMKDVAEEAGVALGTVYHYFASKDRLFAEVLITWAATLGISVTRRPVIGAAPAERLAETLRRSFRAFERQPQLARLVAKLEVSADQAATDILSRLDDVTTGVYLDQLEGVPPELASGVVRVCQAVFASLLRSWCSGRLTAREADRLLAEAVALLLGPVPASPVAPRSPAAD